MTFKVREEEEMYEGKGSLLVMLTAVTLAVATHLT